MWIYDKGNQDYTLVWYVKLFSVQSPADWGIIVDAFSGEIVEKWNATIQYEDGQGKVFDPDPVTDLQDTSLPDNDDNDYAQLGYPGGVYKDITLHELNDPIAGQYRLRGHYAYSFDQDFPNIAPVTQTTPSFLFNREPAAFEEVNIYYHIDDMRRYIGALSPSFNPTWDFTGADPDETLGLTDEALVFDFSGVVAGTRRNAGYFPVSEYLSFGDGTHESVEWFDAGEDHNVIRHEYGHALHDAFTPGGIDNHGWESKGAGEGLGDYLAISYRRTLEPNFLKDVVAPWFDRNGRTLNRSAQYPTNWVESADPHENGRLWATTLILMEEPEPGGGGLSRDVVTTNMLTSLFYVTGNSSILDFVNAMLRADLDVYDGAHVGAMEKVFKGQGFPFDVLTSDPDATAHNGGRRIVRDDSGDYHVVYHSDGEVFYRKYSGGEWEPAIRLSSGNQGNKYPSITERSGTVYVTWQKNTGSNHDIYFHKSTDGGGTWNDSNRLVIDTNVGSAEPLPVILSPKSDNLVIVYRGGSSLTSKHSTDDGSTWPTTESISQSGTLDTPSITVVNKVYWGSAETPALVYASSDDDVYYRYYDSGSWSSAINLSGIVPGSQTHQTPTISKNGGGSAIVHAAWHQTSGSNIFGNTIIYRQSSAHDTWPNEYTEIYYQNQQRPTITAQASYSVDIIFQAFDAEQIVKQHFDGSYWGGPVVIDDGTYPSVSDGGTSAKYVWTSDIGPPYEVKLSSETLSKQGTGGQEAYTRAIAWLDSAGAYLKVHVTDMSVKLSNGREKLLNFLPVSLDTLNFVPNNAWDLLTSELSLLPAEAESLAVRYSVTAENVQNVGVASGSPVVRVGFKNALSQNIGSVSGGAFATTGDIAETSYRVATSLTSIGIPGSSQFRAVVKVGGFHPKSEVFASLGHIYDFSRTSASKTQATDETTVPTEPPATVVLLENYPNPFNPETTIQYTVPQRGRVRLNIYNIQGQVIRTLVDAERASGAYQIRWDGRDARGLAVGSGVYLVQIQMGEDTAVKKSMLLK